jgi:hypothetical protein
VEMKDHHVCLALMGIEFFRDPYLSIGVSASLLAVRRCLTKLEECVELECSGDWKNVEGVDAMSVWVWT